MLTPEQTADTETRLRSDMTKTLRAYGVNPITVGVELYSLLLEELVVDAMHQVERFTDWPEEAFHD